MSLPKPAQALVADFLETTDRAWSVAGIVKQTQVSRPTVRAVLRRYEAEGRLVSSGPPGFTYRVNPVRLGEVLPGVAAVLAAARERAREETPGG